MIIITRMFKTCYIKIQLFAPFRTKHGACGRSPVALAARQLVIFSGSPDQLLPLQTTTGF